MRAGRPDLMTLCAAAALLAAAGCDSGDKSGLSSSVPRPAGTSVFPKAAAPAAPAGSWATLEIPVSTQGEYDDLRIGVGFVREGERPGAAAGAKREWKAGLWIYVRDDRSKNKTIDVFPGQDFKAGGHAVHVEAVNGGKQGSVRLLIEKRPPASGGAR